ncbi:MAG: uncharacterized protein JWM80_2865 [Cyanobacteria bacterium RYN_339]|nr:uncharacterized protein [Cyanobacteria bacterium RYN_339]
MSQITKTDPVTGKAPAQSAGVADAKAPAADAKGEVAPVTRGAAATNSAALSGKPGQSQLGLPVTQTTTHKKTVTQTTTVTEETTTTTTTGGGAATTAAADTKPAAAAAKPAEGPAAEKVADYKDTFGSDSYVKDGANKDLVGLAQKVVDRNPALKDSDLAKHIKEGKLGADDVKALQSELQSKGLDVGHTGADGKYGPNTHAALQKLVGGAKADGPTDQTPLVDAKPGDQAKPGEQPKPTDSKPTDSAAMDKLKSMSADELRKLGPKEFLDALRPAAEEAEKKYGVPAAVTLAQAAYESGYGKHTPGKDSFNFFGVKGKGPAGSTRAASDEKDHSERKVSSFAKYNNAYEAVMEHGKLFHNGYYGKALGVAAKGGTPQQFIKALEGVYHQDGNSYSTATSSIIKKYHLDQK